jgi:hypothetical protein
MALTVHDFVSAMYNLTSILVPIRARFNCDTRYSSNKSYGIQKTIKQKGSGITENRDDERKD